MFERPPFDSDGSFTAWLGRDADVRPPDALLKQVLSRTEATRRRPGWLVIERWFPMDTTARFGAIPRTAIILVILGVLLAFAGAIAVGSQPSRTPLGPGTFSSAPPLAFARASHTATLLPDRGVLVVGGYGDLESSAELRDPITGTFSSTGSLAQGRHFHTATPAAGGRVLVVGGSGLGSSLASAEIWDPVNGSFVPEASLAMARALHTATLLRDGRILIVGGLTDGGDVSELWSPTTGNFSPAGSLAQGRAWHTATLLPDDRVLIVGGPAMAEVWGPRTMAFTPAGSLGQVRVLGTATLLDDGKVLIVGGFAGEAWDSAAAAVGTAELWDPTTDTFSPAGSLSEPRGHHTATLLPDGRVLIVGGSAVDGDQPRSSAEFWDPFSRSFSPAASLAQGRGGHTATLLPDGRVLVVGGYREGDTSLASVEIWDPNGTVTPSAGSSAGP